MRLSCRLFGTLALGVVGCSAPEGGQFRAPPATAGVGGAVGAGASGGSTPAGTGGGGGNSGQGSGGTAGGAGSSGAGMGGSAGAAPLCDMTVPGPAPIRLLTHVQYDNVVADLLGDTTGPSAGFPAENEVAGFRNNVSANQVNPRLVESYQAAAEIVTANALSTNLDGLAPCTDSAGTAECGHAFVVSFGEKAFRRPLDAEEIAIFDELFTDTLPQGYDKAVSLTLRAMLQSPQFLYRVDANRAATAESGAVALGPYELGARLAFFLTNSTPDAELMAAAAQGTLASDAEIEAQARRLIETPRAREMASDFMMQWLGMARLDGAARQAADVTAGPTELVPDWKVSMEAFIQDAVFTEGTMDGLFTSPKIFVTPALAPLYGAPVPTGAVAPVDREGERMGLLTQPALMALLAHADQSAPVLRGVFVREKVMCVEVEQPPPDVNANPPNVDPNATTRERFAQHTADPGCAGCHLFIDGIGWGFEQFDQFGRFRELENGLPINTTGEVVDTGDPELDGPIAGAEDLAARLASSGRVRDCVATQWYRYAMGRVEDESDACSLIDVKKRFADSNGNFRELLVGITLSEAFRYRPAMEAP